MESSQNTIKTTTQFGEAYLKEESETGLRKSGRKGENMQRTIGKKWCRESSISESISCMQKLPYKRRNIACMQRKIYCTNSTRCNALLIYSHNWKSFRKEIP
jgi:hypothetical protein